MTSPLNVAILAAGQGKRMHSALPKVLHPLAGRPLVAHVLAAARTLAPRAIVVVIGHGADAVQAAIAAPDLRFVLQDPPRGTGDATRVALDALPADGVTLVTIGDIPLVPAAALAALVREAEAGKLAVLTAQVPDPSGLGRIVRDGAGRVRAIVEEKDANPAQRAIDEINTGVMAAPTALLRRWVAALKPDNAQSEYYLTDIVALAVADGIPVVAHVAADERDVRGINDRAQLAAVERIVQMRQADALMVAGTTLADPARIDIRGTLACGRDVRIDVGCVFEGDVTLADGVQRRTLLRAARRRRRRRDRHRAVFASGRRHGRRQLPHRSVCAAASRRTRSTTTSTSATSSRSRRARWDAAPRRITWPTSAMPSSAPTSTTAPARSPPTTTAPTSTRRSSATTPASAPTASSSRR